MGTGPGQTVCKMSVTHDPIVNGGGDNLDPFKKLIPSNIKFVDPPLTFPRYFPSQAYCLTGHRVSQNSFT